MLTTPATRPTPTICPMSPLLYAAQLADAAIAQLGDAKALLTGPQPFAARDGAITLPPNPAGNPAVRSANAAIALIDRALALGADDTLGRDVLDAFGRARTQASAGVLQLTAQTLRAINPADVALQFDSASTWLGVAKGLMGFTDVRNPTDPIHIPSSDSPVQ
jgi:hypothetical protein